MTDIISTVWGSSDYTPTANRLAPVGRQLAARLNEFVPLAVSGDRETPIILDLGAGHGELAHQLLERGYEVVALEPAKRMRAAARARGFAARANWNAGTGEQTGLADRSCDGIISNFAAFMCEVPAAPNEWARILRPGAPIVFSAWDSDGFLADMTARMLEITGGSAPHLQWREAAADRLGSKFEQISVTRHVMQWEFASIAAAITEFETGSPVHAFMMRQLADRAGELREALRSHLAEYRDPVTGAVRGDAHYLIIQAKRAMGAD